MKNLYIVLFFLCAGVFIYEAGAQDGPVYPNLVSTGHYWGLTPPLKDLPTLTPEEFEAMAQRKKELNGELKERLYPFAATALPQGPDPAWQKEMGTIKGGKAPILNFNGQTSPVYPPDANGDVSPNHYIQTINMVYSIYNKSGTLLAGPTALNTLFGSVPGSNCNDGDPIVLWDENAQRWLIGEFSLCNTNDRMLIAISQTSDPTGSWHQYSFDVADVPDYMKFGVWRDGYYMGTNTGGGNDIYVFQRSQMLTGGTAQMVAFDNPWRPASGFHCVPPMDNDGTLAPTGTPGYFITINDDAWGGSDQIWIYQLAVNWSSPGSSTFNRTQQINVAAFNSNFGITWDNIAQPGTSQELDAVPQVLMQRPQYRNFGTYQTVVCCHTVDVDNTDHAGIRWYELRRTTGNWTLRQTGTYAPDGHSRWMASIALNGENQIGLGYSISSSSVYPGIRYCGQSATAYAAANNTMDIAEETIYTGTNSQTGYNRWGDYSMIAVDPSNDRTFWYTNQYVGSSNSRRTRIATFEFSPYCAASGGCDEYISNVHMGTINNSTACSGYANYTALSTDLPLNGTLALTVTNGVTSYPSDQCGVWVDWNRDDDFYDANEQITVTGTPGVGPYTATIDPPSSATTGTVTVRIRITYTGTLDPCGATTYGEVEDYTINLTPNAPNQWIGVVSTDWFNPANWSLGSLPDQATNAIIPGGTPYQPTIAGTSPYAYAHDVTVSGNAVLTQTGTSYFYVYGDFNTDAGQYTSTGSAYLYFDGSENNTWDDDNMNDTYRDVRVSKDVPTAYTYMWQDMTVGGSFEIREGELRIDGTWTLTVTSTASNAFEVEDGGKVTINDEHLDIAGRIIFYDGSQAAIAGGSINCGGDFTVNANTSYNIAMTGGTLTMDGSAAQYIHDLDGGTLDLFNLTIDKSGGTCYIGDAALDVNGDLTIDGGTFNSNAFDIYLAGDWDNNVGVAAFVESTGRVVFDGPGHQYIYSSENFNIIEAKMGNALRVNNAAYTVNCNTYDWTTGGIDMIAGTFNANDLADGGLFGGFWVNPGATLNLTQDAAQYVDLNGTIWMGGGNMNVYGGNSTSWWPYAANASVAMSGGTLDFKDVGIYVYPSATYTFTENITGGVIRTSQGFNASRSEFTPSGGIIELYGPSDATLTQANGATFFDLLINKSTKEGNPGPTKQVIENRNGEMLLLGGGIKANSVSNSSAINVTNYMEVAAGTLNLGGYAFTVAHDADVYGTLIMSNAAAVFNVGTAGYDNLSFRSGSTGNISAGEIHLASWIFVAGGATFNATTANTIFFAGSNITGMDLGSTNVVFGNIDVSKTATNHFLYGGIPFEVNGFFTLHGTSVLDMQSNNTLNVHGVFTDASGTKVYVYNGPGEGDLVSSEGSAPPSGAKGCMLEIDTDFTLNGLMDLGTDGNVLVHGNFGIASTGVLTNNGGTFIADKAYSESDAWQYLDGTINLTDGLFEITHNSMRFSSSSVNNISGGIIRCGFTFYATAANVFKPTGGVVEFFGADPNPYIACSNGNWFHDLTIDRANVIVLYSDIQVNRDLLIIAGPLDTYLSSQYNIAVGRNWTNNGGDAAFGEYNSTVTFSGSGSGDITTGETFWNVTLNKTYSGFEGLEVMSVPVVVLNDLTITDGTLEMNTNSILHVGNDVSIALNAGLNAYGETGLELYIGSDWTNNNTSHNTIAGYSPGTEIITFNGAADQIMTTAAPQEDFGNLVIDKPGGAFKPADNVQVLGNFDIFAGNFTYQTTGLTHYFHGNMTLHGPGSYGPSYTSTTVFKGTGDQTYQRLGGSGSFGNIRVDKTADEAEGLIAPEGGEPLAVKEESKDPKALTVTLLSGIVTFNGGTTTIEEGTLDLNGNDYKSSGDININAGGVLEVPAGSWLSIVDGLFVNSGGIFEAIGTSGSNAHVHKDAAGQYIFEVNSGGTIRAQYAFFEDMDANGLYIKSGALVDATYSFHNCTFTNAFSGMAALMVIHNSQDFTVNNAVFPTNTWGGTYNVWKFVDAGHVLFNGATGGFAGPTYEYDPYSRIDWTGFVPGLWTGTVSTNWFTPGNWSDGSVPTASTNVTIPAGCPNFPVISGAPALCDNIDINTGASLTIGNNSLTASGNVEINGLLTMTNAAGVLNADAIYWNAGSSDNVTAGEFHAYIWQFRDGTTAKLGTGNTAYLKDMYFPTDDDAEFGNLVVIPLTKGKENPTDAYYPTLVAGNFTIQNGATWFFPYDLIVAGNATIENGALLQFNSGSDFILTGNLNLAGTLAIITGSAATVSGDLAFPSTGTLNLDEGTFTCTYSAATGWMDLYGDLNMTGSSSVFEIAARNVGIPASFNDDNITAGVMRFGRTLSATAANNFQIAVPVIFFNGNTNHYIQVTNGNYLDDVTINKSGGNISVHDNLLLTGGLTIQAGTLAANDKTITLAGNWNNTVGLAAFSEGTSTVVFNGTAGQSCSDETFFNLTLNKASGQMVIPAGSDVVCTSYDWTAGGITVNGGTFTAGDLADAGIFGSYTMTGGAIALTQDAAQFPDLNGALNFSGGTFSITGGSSASWWGYGEPASVTLSGSGILNFIDNGVNIYSGGALTENITGGTIRTNGSFLCANGAFTPTGGMVEMYGGVTAGLSATNSSNLWNLLINKSGTDGESFPFSERDGMLPEGGKANDVIASDNLLVLGALTVDEGALVLNSFDASVTGNTAINAGGTLTVDDNADLRIGAGSTLDVNNGGRLEVTGSSGNPATVTHISGSYNLEAESGGTIAANWGIFEFMGTNGVYLKSGSLVDPVLSFHNCTFRNGAAGGRLMVVHNNQTINVNNAVFPANTWGGSYNVYKNVNSGEITFIGASGGFAGPAFEYDPYNRVHWTTAGISVSIKVFIEGPYTGPNMSTLINPLLPLSHPYNPPLPYFGNPAPRWLYTGTESVPAIPNANISDWVYVELRDAADAASATGATMVAETVAFLLSNGNIVALDGSSYLQFGVTISQNLFVVIWHRNHLGVMTSGPVPLVSGIYTWDFSTGSGQAYGGTLGHKQIAPGVWGMPSGDGNADGQVSGPDKVEVWAVQAGSSGYLAGDFNLDSNANNTDKIDFWAPNGGLGSQVTDSFKSQVPE